MFNAALSLFSYDLLFHTETSEFSTYMLFKPAAYSLKKFLQLQSSQQFATSNDHPWS